MQLAPSLDITYLKQKEAERLAIFENEENHLFVDFETYYDDEYSLSKKDMTDVLYVKDDRFKLHSASVTRGRNGETVYLKGEIEIEQYLRGELLRHPNTVFIAQRTMFDGTIACEYLELDFKYFGCILMMSRAVYPQASSHSLEAQAYRIWPDDESMRKGDDLILTKGVRVISDELHEKLKVYNDQDTNLTRAIFYHYMDTVFVKPELLVIDIFLRSNCKPPFRANQNLLEHTAQLAREDQNTKVDAAVEYMLENAQMPDGFFTCTDDRDKTKFKTISSYVDGYKWAYGFGPVRKREEMRKFISGNDKFAYILIHGFGINPPTKENDKGKTTWAFGKDDVGFQEMMAKHRDMKVLWDGRIASKSNIAATRAETMLQVSEALDGRLPAPLVYYAAHTGRAGGTQKMNFQNFQRNSNHRKSLEAPDGYVIGVADSSNIEARMSAWFCDFDEKLELFRSGGDPYIEMAKRIYNDMTLGKKTHPEERGVGKATELGCGYQMGADRFRNYLNAGPMGMPPIFLEDIPAMADMANPYKYVIDTYRDYNWPIKDMWRRLQFMLNDLTREDGEFEFECLTVTHEKVWLPNGQYLNYPQLAKGGEGWKFKSGFEWKKTFGGKMLENIIQALSRLVINQQMVWTDLYLEDIGGRVVLQVHDEIITLIPIGNGELDRDLHERLLYGDIDEGDDPYEMEKAKWSDTEYIDSVQAVCEDIMRIPCDWCPDIPLNSEGGYDICYSK